MIQPAPTAPLGSVVTLDQYSPSTFPPDCAILCRNTAPLIAFAFALLRRNRGCRILGRDIGQGLLRTLKQTKASSVDELREKVRRNGEAEVRTLERKNKRAAAAAASDRTACLLHILSNADSITSACATVERLFSDDTGGHKVTLATVHKAKGLEWETVFILDRHLMPSRWAELPWERQQERNIQYVAVTRAKLHLRYIVSGAWEREGA